MRNFKIIICSLCLGLSLVWGAAGVAKAQGAYQGGNPGTYQGGNPGTYQAGNPGTYQAGNQVNPSGNTIQYYNPGQVYPPQNNQAGYAQPAYQQPVQQAGYQQASPQGYSQGYQASQAPQSGYQAYSSTPTPPQGGSMPHPAQSFESTLANPPAGSELLYMNTQAADSLQTVMAGRLNKSSPILVSVMVNLDNLQQSSAFGRLSMQQIASRIDQYGYRIIDVRMRQDMAIVPMQGEFMLSRQVAQLMKAEYNAQAVIVGSYTTTSSNVYCSVRVIRLDDSAVLAAYEYYLPNSGEVRSLLATEVSGGGQSGGGLTVGPHNPYSNLRGDSTWVAYAQRTASFPPTAQAPAPAPSYQAPAPVYKSKAKPKAKAKVKQKSKAQAKAKQLPAKPVTEKEKEEFCMEAIEICKEYLK